MIKTLLGILFTLLFLFPAQVSAQENPTLSTHFRAQVLEIVEENRINQDEEQFFTQKIKFLRLDTDEEIELQVGSEFQPLNANQRLQTGRVMILAEQQITSDRTEIVVVDVYRTPTMIWLFGLFCVLVIIVARWQGLFSILGMFIGLGVLTNFVLPEILNGSSPLLVSILGSLFIGGVTIYLSHGWSLKSHIALGSIIATLAVVAVLSQMAVQAAQVVGLGSEEAYFLQFGNTAKINLQGLLLGGILFGALGVLDDITVSQVSIVYELRRLKKDIQFRELYTKATNVGKDHVASLVNTLVLAYAGANLPLFLLFTINEQVPHWVTLNNEIIIEEVIRTLTGSIGLVLAVPLTTYLATFFALSTPSEKIVKSSHHH